MNLNEELELFVKLTRVLEDALERAAEILGDANAEFSSRNSHVIERPSQIYEDLSDLLAPHETA